MGVHQFIYTGLDLVNHTDSHLYFLGVNMDENKKDEITEEDLKDSYDEGLICGLYMAQEIILAQIECLTSTQQ